ncbi:MAG TPA: GIY-YIG nuclease family protein [Anaerolineales bacterium]|nr:GIY-YIG nuclease family protein [Anaerolineales bacterium]
MPYAIYILKCSDGTYYTGFTKDLEGRAQEHQTGAHPEFYTYGRRPIKLVWSQVTESYQEAFQGEHQIKGWSRAKKEALIRGDIDGIHEIVKGERKQREENKRKHSLSATNIIHDNKNYSSSIHCSG